MGVSGLHPQLKEIQTPSSLEKYRGKTLAVDTYGWLHKATVSCAQELCQNQPTQKYVNSVMKKVQMLRHFGVEPYLVFDGASLPTKAATANERRLRREEAQKKANELVLKGNRKLAWKEFMKAAAVTSQMAKSVMVELDRIKVKYVVAPYEADPQMVYLEKMGLVDGILSEDSDLLIFGCNRLISKLNDFGECIEICREDFSKVTLITNLGLFTQEQLRLVAMLSGCDYTKGVPGVGLKTAFNLVQKYVTIDRVMMALRADGKKIPETFADEFIKADLAFQYQKVFDPASRQLTTLNKYPEPFDADMEVVEECCGLTYEAEIHIGISTGKLHPNTHEILVSREQSISSLKSKSMTSGTSSKSTSKVLSGTQRHILAPKGRIDSFFSKSTTKVIKKEEVPELEKPNAPEEKVSPFHKRTKSLTAAKQLMESKPAPKLGSFSKYFKSKESIQPKLSAFNEADITGDSEITDASSPFKAAITNDILGELDEKDTDDTKTVRDDFDLEDDEIEESPVKSKQSTSAPSHQEPDLKKLLRDTFLYKQNTKSPGTLIYKSSSSDQSSISLNSDLSSDLGVEEDLFNELNISLESVKTKRKLEIKNQTLARFAYK